MKRFERFAYFIAFATLTLSLCGFALYSSSGTATMTVIDNPKSDVALLQVDITSNSSGAVVAKVPVYGELLKVAFDPQAASPSANYDLTLTDQASTDVLLGNGANLSATVTSSAMIVSSTYPEGYPVAGDLTLTAANMGSAKDTRIYLWVCR